MRKFLSLFFALVLGLSAFAEATDVITASVIGITKTGNSYQTYAGVTASSAAVYTINCMETTQYVQLRSNNNTSGIVSTTSGGHPTMVRVTWNASTVKDRMLEVYASKTPYTDPSELYSAETQGTKIGTIVMGTSVECSIEGDYEYIGLRSYDAAMYLDKIEITWSGDVVHEPSEGEDPGEGEEEELQSVSSLISLADFPNGTEFIMGTDLTVVYANGPYNYIWDGNTCSLIYKSNLGLEAGDVIKEGWKATYTIYYDLPEIIPAEALTVDGKADLPNPQYTPLEDAAMAVSTTNLNAYVTVEEVEITETPADKTFTIGDIQFYNRRSLTIEPGTYDITGFVGIYKSVPQLDITSLTPSTSGISAIQAENGKAAYYNLQGVKVENPTPGKTYIKVANGKASKIVK